MSIHPSDDEYAPQVTGHQTENGFAFTVEVRPPSSEDICDALARRMAADYGSAAIKAEVAERFSELVREMVDDVARAEIQSAMQTPRQRTDEFGNPVGEPLSFQQMIAAQVAAWQAETVDRHDGKPKKSDSYNRSHIIPRSEYLVRQVGVHEFEKLAKEEVAKVRAEAKQLVENTVKSAVAASLAAMAK